jgi:cytoskeletal protein RodZ
MVFQTKKIELETLGEYLAEVRQRLDLSKEEVAERAGFNLKFLSSLENGDFAHLPPDVYVIGFLKQIAVIYSIDADSLIEQYRKERGIAKHITQNTTSPRSFKRYFEKLVITPKLLTLVVGLGFVVLTVLYVVWQVLSINRNPALEIFEPQDRQVVKQSSITVSGKTDPGMTVTINDQTVFVDSEGNFQTQLGITPGPKDLIFTAKNKFDKAVTKTISIVGESVAYKEPVKEPLVKLELEFTEQVVLNFSIDGSTTTEEIFNAGARKVLTAMNKILISTSDAGATKVKLNDQDLGILGRPNEKLVEVPFTADTGFRGNGER